MATKPMTDNELLWASNIPGILRQANKPHLADTVQALIDEVARLNARNADFAAILASVPRKPTGNHEQQQAEIDAMFGKVESGIQRLSDLAKESNKPLGHDWTF